MAAGGRDGLNAPAGAQTRTQKAMRPLLQPLAGATVRATVNLATSTLTRWYRSSAMQRLRTATGEGPLGDAGPSAAPHNPTLSGVTNIRNIASPHWRR